MAEAFQPPPTWADVVLVDEATKRAKFNPVWLKWFVDLVAVLNNSGAGGGQVDHQSLANLQGGNTTQRQHLLSAEGSYVTALVAGTQVVSAPSFVSGDAMLLTTSVTLTDSSGVDLGTLTNAPVAGSPNKWISIDDNGTIRYIPTW